MGRNTHLLLRAEGREVATHHGECLAGGVVGEVAVAGAVARIREVPLSLQRPLLRAQLMAFPVAAS
jgi:hypothetical protein